MMSGYMIVDVDRCRPDIPDIKSFKPICNNRMIRLWMKKPVQVN